MQHFVSTQTYALRHFAGRRLDATRDRLAYAWAPRNATGMPAGEFVRETGEILDRLARSIHASDQQDGGVLALGACGAGGEIVWCDGEVEGAAFNDAWKIFAWWE